MEHLEKPSNTCEKLLSHTAPGTPWMASPLTVANCLQSGYSVQYSIFCGEFIILQWLVGEGYEQRADLQANTIAIVIPWNDQYSHGTGKGVVDVDP